MPNRLLLLSTQPNGECICPFPATTNGEIATGRKQRQANKSAPNKNVERIPKSHKANSNPSWEVAHVNVCVCSYCYSARTPVYQASAVRTACALSLKAIRPTGTASCHRPEASPTTHTQTQHPPPLPVRVALCIAAATDRPSISLDIVPFNLILRAKQTDQTSERIEYVQRKNCSSPAPKLYSHPPKNSRASSSSSPRHHRLSLKLRILRTRSISSKSAPP